MQASPIVLTTLAGLSTGLGGVLAALAKPSETMLAASAGFAGGVMLTASLADLMPEALEFYSGYLQPLPCGGAIVTLLALGMLTAGLLGRLLPEETELAAKYGQNTARTKAMRTALITGTALLLHNFPEGVLTLFAGTADPALGLRTALAIALHNIPEGMAIGVVYAGYLAGNLQISAMGALALSIGIAIQNFPEGAIISMPLKAEGVSKSRSFLYGTLSGAVEPIGAILTILLAGILVPVLPYALSFAAGAMVYVVVEELIPEMSVGKHSNIGTILFAVGFTLMMTLDVALGA